MASVLMASTLMPRRAQRPARARMGRPPSVPNRAAVARCGEPYRPVPPIPRGCWAIWGLRPSRTRRRSTRDEHLAGASGEGGVDVLATAPVGGEHEQRAAIGPAE